MGNGKEKCEKLYNKYKELKEKIELDIQDINKTTGEIKAKITSENDEKELSKVKRELKECLELLPGEQLIEISGDPNFMKEAEEILMKRRKYKIN